VLAVDLKSFGGPEVIHVIEVPDPVPGAGELLVRVHATAVNRADVLQRRGLYPPPSGASPYLGLEIAGTVLRGGLGFVAGDRVMALLPGGGYAQLATVPADMLMRIPSNLSFEQAAAFPEVWMTAYDNLFNWGRLAEGEIALVHGGGSGVGTAAIQLVKAKGARVIVTAGSKEKLDRCRELGADAGIDYKTEDFVARVKELTREGGALASSSGGGGVDVVLDVQGAAYLEKNLRSLAIGGRIVVIGMQGGTKAELDLGMLMARRGSLMSTSLRARPLAAKVALTRQMEREVLPEVASGKLKPIVDRVFDLADAAEAHRYLESSGHFGKLVLRVP
jgi:putative PIG3 family NAD(P)H quinone oxidoreductase